MDFQEFKNLEGRGGLLRLIGAIFGVFLLALIVSTAIDIQNKIKEGRYIGRDIEAQNVITVSGTGEIYAKPDLALVSFSVVTEKEDGGERQCQKIPRT